MIKTRILWGFWILFLLTGSLFSGSVWGLGLLFLTVALWAFSGIFCMRSFVEAALFLPPRAEKGEAVTGRIDVKNSGKVPIAGVKFCLRISNLLTGEIEKTDFLISLAPGERLQKTFRIKSRFCGTIRISTEKVEYYDLFRVVRKKRPFRLEGKLFVLPAMEEQALPVLHLKTPMESDTYAEYKWGHDMSETYDIREYQPGDQIKNLHWKMTAKSERMMVRVGSLPVDRTILVLFDCFYRKKEAWEPALLDRHAERFFCFSRNLIENHLAHTAAWFDREADAFCFFAVTSEESLADMMESILSMSHVQSEKGILELCLEKEERMEFGTIYLESLEPPEEIPEIFADKLYVLEEKEQKAG